MAGSKFTDGEKKYRRSIRVAMCQIVCLDGDREGNFARIEHALTEAKQASAQIACFPESAILGWVNPDAHKRAAPIPGQDTDRLCRLAKDHGLYLCIGIDELDNECLYDSAILVDPDGRIVLKHRKVNTLPELMYPPYMAGTVRDITPASTPLGKIGLVICADTFEEAVLQKIKRLGVDLLLVPYGWAAEEKKWPRHGMELHRVVKRTAESIGAPVVGTDLVGQISHGPWTGQVYGGQSIAVDAKGNTLAIAADRDRDIRIVTIPIGGNQSQV